MNKIVLVGRLTRDVELGYTANTSTACGKFTLAVDRPKREGKDKEVDFIPVITWSKLAETCAQHIGKGLLVAVSGSLQIRSYEDRQGQKRIAAEVIADSVRFLEFKPREEEKDDDESDYDLPF